MNPSFELEQIERYIDYLDKNPYQLKDTVESHFLPVIQRIFFREGFEVKPKSMIGDRKFPFVLVDLDSRRPPVAVDFHYQVDKALSVIPNFAYEWAEASKAGRRSEVLMLIRNAPLHERLLSIIEGFCGSVRFLDFAALKQYATNVFRVAEETRNSRAVVVVIEFIEKLIQGIAEEKINIQEIQWFDIERLFHRLIEGFGFHAHLTPVSKDGGRDILACEILVDGVNWYSIEIKHWKNKRPGKKEVASFLDTSIKESRKGALFFSTSGITESAIRLKTEVGHDFLRFADKSHLITSCKHYTQSANGVWAPFKTLREYIFTSSF